MNFLWCTIKVKNMDESLNFYKEILDLEVMRRFNAGPGVEIAFLGHGETKIELIHDENSKDVNIGEDISLGFGVKSIEKTMENLKQKGIHVHSGPFKPNPHIQFFYVLDPNDLKIQFVENI